MALGDEIYRAAEACSHRFEACLANPACREYAIPIRSAEGDFNLWCSAIKATSRGKVSLDYRLRNRHDVREVVCELLVALEASLERWTRRATVLSAQENEKEPESTTVHSVEERPDSPQSTDSPASWDAISDEWSAPGSAKDRSTLEMDPAMDECMSYIRIALDQLARTSLAIRKAGDKYRFEKIDAKLNDNAFEEFRNHLTTIILRSLVEPQDARNFSAEDKMKQVSNHEALTSVQKRLVRANILRRHRIEYVTNSRQEARQPVHQRLEPAKISSGLKKSDVQTSSSVTGTQISRQAKPEIAKDFPTPSVVLEPASTATDVDSRLEVQRFIAARTPSEMTKITQIGSAQTYPDRPTRDSNGRLICPYCHDMLPSSYATVERSWRAHVTQDLIPYTCFIEQCETPFQMYLTSENLSDHLIDKHSTKRWTCNFCRPGDQATASPSIHTAHCFGSAEEWKDHVTKTHSDRVKAEKLQVLGEMSTQTLIGPLSCPFCDFATDTEDARVDDHILQHLHEFSLRALPERSALALDDRSNASQLSDSLSHVRDVTHENQYYAAGHPTPHWKRLSSGLREALSHYSSVSSRKLATLIYRGPNFNRIPESVADEFWSFHLLKMHIALEPFISFEEAENNTDVSMEMIQNIVEETSQEVYESLHAHEDNTSFYPGKEESFIFGVPSAPIFQLSASQDDKKSDVELYLFQQQSLLYLAADGQPKQQTRVVLTGPSGMGKTLIARTIANEIVNGKPNCSVFWIDAFDFDHISNAFSRLHGDLSGADETTDANRFVVYFLNWLLQSQWLMVLDGIDGQTLLRMQLEGLLPSGLAGRLLLTTEDISCISLLGQAKEVRLPLDKEGAQPFTSVTVGKMSKSEAMKMLTNFIEPRQMQDQDSTEVLLDLLAGMPLAIQLAAAYMARTSMTTKQYLQTYRDSDTSRMAFLSREVEDRGRPEETANPISQTWLVSFDHIKKHHPLAVRYLNLICFLAEEDIPLELFPEEDLKNSQREEAIGVLLGYSFIMERGDGDSFDIHRLVRLATRNSMNQTDADKYLTIIADKLLQQYPYPEHGNLHICVRYTPHVEAVLGSKGTNLDSQTKAELLERAGRNYTQLEKDEMAMTMHQDELRLRQEVLGLTHKDTLTSMHSLALLLAALGRYNHAQQILRHVVRLREEQIGPRHPDTLSSLDSLGNVLYDMGWYEEAEQIHRRSLYRRQLRFGIKHIETLHAMNNWALALGALGRHTEAEKVHRQEWHLCKELLGEGDPETLYSMNNLGLMVMKLGQYETAEELLRDCLSLRRTELGPTHPDTLVTLNNLALVLGELEEFEEAESMHREELQLFRKIMGPTHPDILISMNNLATVLERAGKDDEAEEIFQATERLRKEIESPTTPSNKSGTDMDIIISMYDDLEAEVKP